MVFCWLVIPVIDTCLKDFAGPWPSECSTCSRLEYPMRTLVAEFPADVLEKSNHFKLKLRR